MTAGTMGPGDHQRAQLNGAIDALSALGEAAGSSGERVVKIVLDYLAVLERAAPAVAIKHRGADTVHVTDPAQVARTVSYHSARDDVVGADDVGHALVHLLAGDPNSAGHIVDDLDPADLAAVQTAASRLGDLVGARVWHLLRVRQIGPGAR